MKLTNLEKQALQMIVDEANEIDEDNGVITYLCAYDIDEKSIQGFRGVCSSLIQKDIICITDNAYCNVVNIPIDENGKVQFELM